MANNLESINTVKYMKLLLFGAIFLQSCGINTSQEFEGKPTVNLAKTASKASQAYSFCQTNGMNTEFCILIDMSLHSGVNRLFVWDFEKNEIIYSFLVGHGCGDGSWGTDGTKDRPQFSNTNNSHCSSLGKYAIGERGYSNWGVNVKYILHGMEATNNMAQRRIIVFHAWDKMEDNETFPVGSPEGWGCPTIANNNFKTIDPLLKHSKRPVLMWMYQ